MSYPRGLNSTGAPLQPWQTEQPSQYSTGYQQHVEAYAQQNAVNGMASHASEYVAPPNTVPATYASVRQFQTPQQPHTQQPQQVPMRHSHPSVVISLNSAVPVPNTSRITSRSENPADDASITDLRDADAKTNTQFEDSATGSTNHQLLLLSLAEQYITVAHSIRSGAGQHDNDQDVKRYRKLMATALAALECVLRTYRMQSRPEALVRLRFAALLFDETSNYKQAEEVLAKGITLCERNKMLDLKYSMQHLLVRVIYQSNARAAFKYIDKLVPDIEAEQHVAWIYAFRFLRTTMSLQLTPQFETSASVANLRAVANLAERCGDVSVYVTATSIEALVHMRSMGAESMEQAQHAIAAARQWQLGMKGQDIAPIAGLLDLVDLICSAQSGMTPQAMTKMHNLHTTLDAKVFGNVDGADSGEFAVLLDHSSSGALTAHTGGIFQKADDGRDMLSFSWLPRSHIMTLGYFFSGVTSFQKMEGRAEKYLTECMKQIQAASSQVFSIPGSVGGSVQNSNRAAFLEWYITLYLAFIACARANWSRAKECLDKLLQTIESVSALPSDLPRQLVAYVSGVICQATGRLEEALETYQSPQLRLHDKITPHVGDPTSDLRLLASLNSLLILCDIREPQSAICGTLLAKLEPLCRVHPNKNIAAAYSFCAAYATLPSTVVHTKQCISATLSTARSTGSNQLMCLGMTALAKQVFTGIMGNQAEQCTSTARQLSSRWGDPVWRSVSAGMLADTMELSGKAYAAEAARQEAASLRDLLPERLQQQCMTDSVGLWAES